MKPLAFIALLLTGCQPVPVAIPIAPAVERAAGSVRAANVSAARLETRVGGIQRSASTLRQDIATATAEADRLRRLGSATPAELEAQWLALSKIKTASVLLHDQSKQAVAEASERKRLGIVAEAGLADLSVAAKATDQNTARQAVKLAKQSGDAALGKALKVGFWIAIALALSIIILRFLKPL